MKKLLSVILLVIISQTSMNCSHKRDKHVGVPPEWSKNVIWYQIFVERFHNGDPSNDPIPENIYATSNFRAVPEDWSVTPWTQNWYEQEDWAKNLKNTDFYGALQHRRYGGDLQGVMDKLDYLEDLGITAIYFNPINDAPSLHKYDARNYHHIDVNFGPDPEGDNKIIAKENPNDPNTWQWTSADKLFLTLVDELHKRNIRVIMDYSWNHTGVEFWAWKDILKNQEKSKYNDWYEIKKFDDPATEKNEFDYHAWLGIRSLPEIKKVNLTTTRRIGQPYQGDINVGAKKHIYDVTKRWLEPDGDVSKGIDGYRLDVADHIGLVFWRDWYQYVKSINPEAYLVGEIWWEKWPDKFMDPLPYVGDVFDAIMFYHAFRPARHFFGFMNEPIDAAQLRDSLDYHWSRLSKQTAKSMMNVSATHDSPRLLTSFANPTKYKYQAKPNDNPEYISGKPNPNVFDRVRLYLVYEFTITGAPHIWNGDEMGMWGADDPDCRKPLWWPEFDFEPEYRNNFQDGKKQYDEVGFNQDHFNFYKKMIKIRKDNPVLTNGDLKFLETKGKYLSYMRYDENDQMIILFNMDNEKRDFDIPANETYLNLMNGTEVVGKSIKLLPLTAVILKKINK
jgi:glycosidase